MKTLKEIHSLRNDESFDDVVKNIMVQLCLVTDCKWECCRCIYCASVKEFKNYYNLLLRRV